MASGRGNVAKFQRDLARVTEQIVAGAKVESRERLVEFANEIADQADSNSRSRMGHKPGPPDIQGNWYVSSYAPQNTDSLSEIRSSVASAPNARTLYVGNHAFTSWFHEFGYYSKSGGSRPKFMLRDALLAIKGRLGLA